MANFDPNILSSRDPSRFQRVEGTQLSVQTFATPPISRLGSWNRTDRYTGQTYQFTFEPGQVVNGSMIAVATNKGVGAIYNELYVWVESQGNWKKVDLNWPKIDPNTGRPFDQFLDWYSPLAE